MKFWPNRAALVALALSALSVLPAGCGPPAIPPQQNYATVSGRVYDAATNAPVGGAVVTVLAILVVTSAGDGSYTVPNVPAGPIDLTVQPPAGYARPADSTFSVTAGDRFKLDIPLNRN